MPINENAGIYITARGKQYVAILDTSDPFEITPMQAVTEGVVGTDGRTTISIGKKEPGKFYLNFINKSLLDSEYKGLLDALLAKETVKLTISRVSGLVKSNIIYGVASPFAIKSRTTDITKIDFIQTQ